MGGGIVSPLLANIALSVLDEHFTGKWDGSRTGYGHSPSVAVPGNRS